MEVIQHQDFCEDVFGETNAKFVGLYQPHYSEWINNLKPC